MLAARVLRVFGFRFDLSHYEANGKYLALATFVELVIWAVALYLMIVGTRHLIERHRRQQRETAAA